MRLNHFLPLTPLSSAANMRSVQIVRSIQGRSAPVFDEPCLVTCDTVDPLLSRSLIPRFLASTFLPSFPEHRLCCRCVSRMPQSDPERGVLPGILEDASPHRWLLVCRDTVTVL